MFGFNNDRLFPDGRETVKDHISNTKPEKGDNYCTVPNRIHSVTIGFL